MIPHALARNLVLPVMYLVYFINKQTKSLEPFYKIIHYLLCFAAPILYLVLIRDTWDYWYSPFQYYVYYLIFSFVQREKPFSEIVTQTVCMLATIGYLYEVPKWLGISVFELIRSSQYTLIEWGFMSAVIFFLFFAEYRVNTKTVCTLSLYCIYCIVYMTHLRWLSIAAYTLHIPRLVMKRLPATLLVLSLTHRDNVDQHSAHLSAWHPNDFQKHGYETRVVSKNVNSRALRGFAYLWFRLRGQTWENEMIVAWKKL